jgi:hypothetical protein
LQYSFFHFFAYLCTKCCYFSQMKYLWIIFSPWMYWLCHCKSHYYGVLVFVSLCCNCHQYWNWCVLFQNHCFRLHCATRFHSNFPQCFLGNSSRLVYLADACDSLTQFYIWWKNSCMDM